MRWVLVALALAGCRLDFLEHDPLVDDARNDARSGDADDTALGPWSPPVLVSELYDSAHQKDDPSLTKDLLEMYFDDDRFFTGGGAGDVWVVTRASTADPWGTPAYVPALAKATDDTTPDLTPDGLSLYFASDRVTPGDRDLFLSTRADRQSAWSGPIPIPEVDTTSDEGGVCVSTDGLTMIFGSTRSGGGDLFITTRPDTGSPWSAAVAILNLSSPVEESQQWCNDDLTLVYFASRATGDLDIWMTSRATPADTFAPPTRVNALSVPQIDDADPWLSPDLRTIYFFRNTPGAGSIYMSTR